MGDVNDCRDGNHFLGCHVTIGISFPKSFVIQLQHLNLHWKSRKRCSSVSSLLGIISKACPSHRKWNAYPERTIMNRTPFTLDCPGRFPTVHRTFTMCDAIPYPSLNFASHRPLNVPGERLAGDYEPLGISLVRSMAKTFDSQLFILGWPPIFRKVDRHC